MAQADPAAQDPAAQDPAAQTRPPPATRGRPGRDRGAAGQPGAHPGYRPRNPAFEQRLRDSFAGQRMMALLGVELVRVAPGVCELAVDSREDLTQQHGLLHGGLVGMLLDTACSGAALTLLPAGSAVLATEYKVNFLAPAVGRRLVARGTVLRPGKLLTVASGEAHMLDGAGGSTLVAACQSTMVRLDALRRPARGLTRRVAAGVLPAGGRSD